MARVVGFKNRRPFLYVADLDARRVSPLGELDYVPQAIDAIVPIPDGVAIRAGLQWRGLRRDLSGQPFALSARQLAIATAVTDEDDGCFVSCDPSISAQDAVLWIHRERVMSLRHESIKWWGNGPAALAAGRDLAAVIGKAAVPLSLDELSRRRRAGEQDRQPQDRLPKDRLCLVDVVASHVDVFARPMGNASEVVWIDGDTLVLVDWAEPKQMLLAHRSGTITEVKLPVHAPQPLIDADVLGID